MSIRPSRTDWCWWYDVIWCKNCKALTRCVCGFGGGKARELISSNTSTYKPISIKTGYCQGIDQSIKSVTDRVHFITTRKRSLRRLCFWGKVIFLHLSGVPCRGVCYWGGPGPGGLLPGGACGDTPRMATVAGGMHPTGMHSCYRCLSTGGGVPGQVHPPHRQVHPPGHSACWDMVNKWAIHIPPECTLVHSGIYLNYFLKFTLKLTLIKDRSFAPD